MSNTHLSAIYKKTKYLSIKYDSYFPVYELLLGKYVNQKITLIEVGVFNGGSLFMWREFLGPQAKIIGVDMNPIAKEWEKFGFDIYIGDQSSESFWADLYKKIGAVDVVIDDGGHTNRQQITTAHYAIQNINDGGVLIVEDVHTNYFREFGNPFKFSFINFAFQIVHAVNSRAHALKTIRSRYASSVHGVSFYESIVAFHINKSLCKRSVPTSNHGETRDAADFRYQGRFQSFLFQRKNKISQKMVSRPSLIRSGQIFLIDKILWVFSRSEVFAYKKFFGKK